MSLVSSLCFAIATRWCTVKTNCLLWFTHQEIFIRSIPPNPIGRSTLSSLFITRYHTSWPAIFIKFCPTKLSSKEIHPPVIVVMVIVAIASSFCRKPFPKPCVSSTDKYKPSVCNLGYWFSNLGRTDQSAITPWWTQFSVLKSWTLPLMRWLYPKMIRILCRYLDGFSVMFSPYHTLALWTLIYPPIPYLLSFNSLSLLPSSLSYGRSKLASSQMAYIWSRGILKTSFKSFTCTICPIRRLDCSWISRRR